MVFVVNTELNMGVGKIAAQVGHAAVGLYQILTSKPQKYDYMLSQWDDFGLVFDLPQFTIYKRSSSVEASEPVHKISNTKL